MMTVRLHALEPASRANGPGLRAVIWFQGCTLRCHGCFNPATHDPTGGIETDTAKLATDLLARPNRIEGVSFSGGEPFQQPEALLDLLQRLRGSGLSTLAFSGYTLREIEQQAQGPAILRRLDVLVAGRYIRRLYSAHSLLGSANQRIHLLTNRYTPLEVGATPRSEVILHRDGSITVSGIAPIQTNLQRRGQR